MIRVFIPNLITCLNLFCGCMGILFAFQTNLVWASYMIFIAAIFDFFDGFAARLLNGASELGKQLDSLADAVTFGVLPAIMLYQFISISYGVYFLEWNERTTEQQLIPLAGFLLAIFSVLRLAKFNVDTKQSDSFLGLPTPSSAIIVASIPIIMEIQYKLNLYYPINEEIRTYLAGRYFYREWDMLVINTLFEPSFYIALTLILCFLLVVRLPLLALKFKTWRWKSNEYRYLLIILSILVAAPADFTGVRFLAIPIIILLYIVISIIQLIFKNKPISDEI